MGHLTNIANSVVRQTDGCLGDFLTQHIDEDTLISWQHYVESTLKPTNELHSRVLVSAYFSSSSHFCIKNVIITKK